MKDEIKSELVITDFTSLEEIEKEINLKPTIAAMKGDVRRVSQDGLKTTLHKQNVWVMQSSIPTSASVEDHIDKILSELEPYTDQIAGLAGKYHGEISIYGFAEHATRQAIHIDQAHILRLAKMGLDLDIDVYPLADE